MSQELLNQLDIPLAWKRVKIDISYGRSFVEFPFELSIIETDEDSFLESICTSIVRNTYYPGIIQVCDVPKKNYGIRAGNYIPLTDRVIYTACIGALLPDIYAELQWSQGVVDYAYQLHSVFDSEYLFKNHFKAWDSFREISEERLEVGANYVVISDITAFYDNIDIQTLISCIKSISSNNDVINLLSSCLNRWSHSCGNRGIIQGQTASHILAKLYLNSIDQAMQSHFDYCRYNDDIRIFCATERTARQSLAELTRLLRSKGLSVQTSKSGIHSKEEASYIFSNVEAIVLSERDAYISQLRSTYSGGSGSDDSEEASIEDNQIAEIESAGDNIKQIPVEIAQQVYKKYFIEITSDFDKSLFHHLLNRFKKECDDFAAEHCVSLLWEHPEETKEILSYLESIEGIYHPIEDKIIELVKSDSYIYEYQIYLIIRWICLNRFHPSMRMLAEIRRLAFDFSSSSFLRAWSRAILARFGTSADLEKFEHSYAQEPGSLERSELICCLHKMETGRRNSFISRAQNDGDLQRRATTIAKNGHALFR